MNQTVEKWDIFISHASEDKENFVEPLASALAAFGVNVWYDSYALKLGDSLSRSIDQGLARSDYGLVVLSPAFIAKKWPEYELRGLTARELTGSKVILPIWHNVSLDDILRFSPPLADKLAIRSSNLTPVQIAVKIIETIRPDIFTQILRRISYYLSQGKGEVVSMDPSKLLPAPIQHKELPPDLVSRIRLIRASLLGAYTHSMEFWLDGFKRDAHPSQEIAIWEHVAAVYREYVAMAPPLADKQHEQIIRVLFLLMNKDLDKLEENAQGLPDDALEIIMGLYAYPEPIYDIKERIPFAEMEPPSEEVAKMFEALDKERLPDDLPEELIRELMGTKDSGLPNEEGA